MPTSVRQFDLSPLRGAGKTCLVASVLIGAYGCFGLQRAIGLATDGRPASARVFYTDHLARSADDPLDPWHREARYSTVAYRTVVFQTGSGERVVDQSYFSFGNIQRDGLISPKVVPQERTASILFDPADPKEWVFEGFYSHWGLPIASLLGALGWGFYALAVGMGWIPVFRLRIAFLGTRPQAAGTRLVAAAKQA